MYVGALRAPTGLTLPQQPSWGSPMAQDPISCPSAISLCPRNAALPWAPHRARPSSKPTAPPGPREVPSAQGRGCPWACPAPGLGSGRGPGCQALTCLSMGTPSGFHAVHWVKADWHEQNVLAEAGICTQVIFFLQNMQEASVLI